MKSKEMAVMGKLAILQKKITMRQKRQRNPAIAIGVGAGAIIVASEVVDKLLDTAIWVVDKYWNVPPTK